MYHRSRICYRFKSFTKRQVAIAHFAKKFLKEANENAKLNNKKVVVFFGNGSFRPGGTGYAAVPRKPFLVKHLESAILASGASLKLSIPDVLLKRVRN